MISRINRLIVCLFELFLVNQGIDHSLRFNVIEIRGNLFVRWGPHYGLKKERDFHINRNKKAKLDFPEIVDCPGI